MITPGQVQQHFDQLIAKRTEEIERYEGEMVAKAGEILALDGLRSSLIRIMDKQIVTVINSTFEKLVADRSTQVAVTMTIELPAVANAIHAKAPDKVKRAFSAEHFAWAMRMLLEQEGHDVDDDLVLYLRIDIHTTASDGQEGEPDEIDKDLEGLAEAIGDLPSPPPEPATTEPPPAPAPRRSRK